ncbi:MAG: 16S rRNA (guanine(966)-N(2))-methyltransferase RsmD [Cocleimonas sp.]
MAKKAVAKNKAQINTRNAKSNNTLRIIGGEWRSRKLPFVDAPGLRPTPDRIRETLFNWLQGNIHGANCIDMFAGSGALGFEALSRGAKDVIFVEKNVACAAQLNANLALLNAEARVIQSDALGFLSLIEKPDTALDIVFLDPPYRQDLIEKSLNYLFAESIIDENSLIYLEHESEANFDWSDFGLQILKQAKAGQVHSFLLKRIKIKEC